jgi:hypothetical protein
MTNERSQLGFSMYSIQKKSKVLTLEESNFTLIFFHRCPTRRTSMVAEIAQKRWKITDKYIFFFF